MSRLSCLSLMVLIEDVALAGERVVGVVVQLRKLEAA
jgi:hypothetical protein